MHEVDYTFLSLRFFFLSFFPQSNLEEGAWGVCVCVCVCGGGGGGGGCIALTWSELYI